jgi:PilZ domain-containing protein
MPEPVLNPRRSPRASIPCAAQVALRLDTFIATRVLDYGPGGCQLEVQGPVECGSRVYLKLTNESVSVPALLTGHVAWSSEAEPWRIGVAFDDDVLTSEAARKFFGLLEAAHPGASDRDPFVDGVTGETMLAPTPPPATLPTLSDEEVNVLRTIGPAMRVDDLRATLGESWSACRNPMFALLSKRYLVVGGPNERAAAGWAHHLSASVVRRDEGPARRGRSAAPRPGWGRGIRKVVAALWTRVNDRPDSR